MANTKIEKRDGKLFLVAELTKETRQYARDGRGHSAGDTYEAFIAHTSGLEYEGKVYRFDLSMPMKAWKSADDAAKKKLLATLKKLSADKAAEIKDASVEEITEAIKEHVVSMLAGIQ